MNDSRFVGIGFVVRREVSFFTQLMLFVAVVGSFLCSPSFLAAATKEERVQWVAAHNRYRTLHGVSPVRWSDELAASSRSYAETCPSGHSETNYGENLSWASYDMGVSSVVKMWYGEESRYDYGDPGFVSGVGHFTQVVWKDTAEIGCAHVRGCGPAGSVRANTWICQYAPAGNFVSKFSENVLPPRSGK